MKTKDNKNIILKSKKNIPSLKVINNVYTKINDDVKVPIVFQTKKQYLKEYIKNQEKANNIDYPRSQEQAYVNTELRNMRGITSRYTTKSNPYMKPRVVFFTDNKISNDQFKRNAYHEYGHEIFERNGKVRKQWKNNVSPSSSPTPYGKMDCDEDFAESYSLNQLGLLKGNKERKSILNLVNKQEIEKDDTSKNSIVSVKKREVKTGEDTEHHYDIMSNPNVNLRTHYDDYNKPFVKISNISYRDEFSDKILGNKTSYNDFTTGLKTLASMDNIPDDAPVEVWEDTYGSPKVGLVGDFVSKNNRAVLQVKCPECKRQFTDQSYTSIRDINEALYNGEVKCPYCKKQLKATRPKYEAHPNFVPFG